jgi:hypothetical protein
MEEKDLSTGPSIIFDLFPRLTGLVLGIPALGADLKSRKGLRTSPSPIQRHLTQREIG